MPTLPQIRVLVVDDSAFMRTALSRMINSESGLEVIATACDGVEALEKISALNPDVVTLDIEMPRLDGLATLRRIMNQFPRPVIMVSSSTEKDAENTFDALAAGAFDYVPKQLSPTSLDILHIRHDLVTKIQAAAQSRVSTSHSIFSKKPSQPAREAACDQGFGAVAIVAIGTSTGGTKALQEILPLFPADLSVPILVVQHMPLGFTAPFAQRINALCSVSVREALHGEPIQPGVVYIAPAGMHMTVQRPSDSLAFICLDTRPEDCPYIPSIDILMKSVATAFRHQAMAVIMTGMGSDGAEGVQAIHRQGGLTLGQDEATCAVFSMPRACVELGAISHLVPLSEIPGQILLASRYRRVGLVNS